MKYSDYIDGKVHGYTHGCSVTSKLNGFYPMPKDDEDEEDESDRPTRPPRF